MMPVVNQIILKVAGHCNLNCSYCYLYNHEDTTWQSRPKEMSDSVFDRTLEVIREYCSARPRHKIELLFHGGEPTLIGVRRFEEFTRRARDVLGSSLARIGIQTNGTLLSPSWIACFADNGVYVGVSMDGPKEIHDSSRRYLGGRGSHHKVLEGLTALQEAGLDPSVLVVIQPGTSGIAAYDHVRSLGVRRVSFLLPDVSHDNKDRLFGTYGVTPVARYLLPILDRWLSDDDPNIIVEPFWSLVATMLGGRSRHDAFGNALQSYIVIETDGSMEPLDALKVCDDGITSTHLNVSRNSIDDIVLAPSILRKAIIEGYSLPAPCEQCNRKAVCGGGYLPHRFSKSNGFKNESVWCADIQRLLERLDHSLPESRK